MDFRDAGDGRRERVWRHPGFFRYKAFIHAAMPSVTCPVHRVRTVPAPWARPGSGFTLLFEAWAVEMARRLPAGTLAGRLDKTDTRLWRFISHYVDEARRLEDCTGWRPSASTGPSAGVTAPSPWSPIRSGTT